MLLHWLEWNHWPGSKDKDKTNWKVFNILDNHSIRHLEEMREGILK
jgi:hypothetical protein